MSNQYITIDCETCGLAGVPVLLQWAQGDGEVHLENLWKKSAKQVVELFEFFCYNPDGILAFNASFDWFMVYKFWTMLKSLPQKFQESKAELEDYVDDIAEVESAARDYPDVLKPQKCFDVFLHARKTEYQSTMDRKDIRIRRIPTVLAGPLAKELEKRIPFKNIYFARRKKKDLPKWQVMDIKDSFGDIDPDWKDIVVKFAPSSGLKALAADALKIPEDKILKFGHIEVHKKFWPKEAQYAPFAAAMGGRRGSWKGTWPEVIRHHISHWAFYEPARQYAGDDVTYTRNLYKYFGSPKFDDDDSVLAFMVGMVRWRGFSIDIEGIKELKKACNERRYTTINGFRGKIPTAPNDAKRFINQVLSPTEQLALKVSNKSDAAEEITRTTKKAVLEKLSKFTVPCPGCLVISDEDPKRDILKKNCPRCKGTEKVPHPASIRAQMVLDARKVDKEEEIYDKLLQAGRFHAGFKVIGALSSRMSGDHKLNAQGIKKTKTVRGQFTLAWPGYKLCGGDFDGFEVTIAEAFFNDEKLRKDLLTCEKCKTPGMILKNRRFTCQKCGSTDQQAIHGLFGTFVYPPMTYDEVKATKGTEDDKYTRSKSAVFAMLYGAEAYTLESRLAVLIDVAERAVQQFSQRYPGVGRRRKEIHDKFGTLRQEGSIGTKIHYTEPAEKIDTMYGFSRYFTLENMIVKTLYQLASKMPPVWRDLKIKVQRRDRLQTGAGAVSSALYGAAFTIQGSNKRAAGNHVIQGTGAQITKKVQCAIWQVQPKGIAPWRVQNMNVHDEVLSVTHPDYVDEVDKIVSDTVETVRPVVPLIMLKWRKEMRSWAEK